MADNIQYGYLTPETSVVKVKMKKGQNISGFPIGILYIDEVSYPMLPGNIVNGYTFPFPVRLMPVKGLDVPHLFNTTQEVYPKILEASEQLKKEGVRAISAACGFFGNYQKQLAKSMDIPVAISSLVQIPWIAALLKEEQKIGILTADMSSLSDKLLENCGVGERLKKQLVIKDLRHEKEFSCILEGRGEFDNSIVRNEVVSKALEIKKEYPDVGAILLECSDMPPYAYAVQAAVKLPVFDFTTLIKWLHSSVCQMPYNGFI
jgi:Asp/Glu/hydantoin racemase